MAAYGQKDAPELDLKGAIALAPGGYQYEGIAEYVKTNPNPEPSVAAFSQLFYWEHKQQNQALFLKT